MECLPTSCV
jgi:hypothetical protein